MDAACAEKQLPNRVRGKAWRGIAIAAGHCRSREQAVDDGFLGGLHDGVKIWVKGRASDSSDAGRRL